MSLPRTWPRLAGLVTYYERSVEALDHLDRATRVGRSKCFVGMSVREVGDALGEMRTELDREVTLALMAASEALLRVDSEQRLGIRRKEIPSISRRFKALADDASKSRRGGVPLVEILELWKSEVNRPARFAAFEEYVKVRHWLAHGRYWEPRSARKPVPQDVLVVIDALFGVLPGF